MARVAPTRRRSLPDWAGDARVWAVAGAAGALVLVALLAYLLVPRDFYTGTNSVTTRSIVVELAGGQEVCVRGLTIPAGTGQVRLSAGASHDPARSVAVVVFGGGQTLRGTFPGSQLQGAGSVNGFMDVPIPTVASDIDDAQVCVMPRGGTTWLGGMVGLQGNSVQPTLNGQAFASRVGVWFMPPAGEQRSLLSQTPAIMERLALFRPGIVGPWTYWLLFFVGLPALVLGSITLLARAAAGLPARLPRALAIWLIGFACAGSFALITPLFQTPDEGEHFAAVQYIAETGNANDRSPVPNRLPYSNAEAFALEAVNVFSLAESPHGRPPWREADERAWTERVAKEDPSRSNGGGFAIATSAHSPLYYTLLAPAYLAVRDSSVASQLTAMRLMSSVMAALVAMFAFLIMRELLPRQPWAAVAAGLIVAFQPMFGFMGGAINNDMGINAAAAAVAYLIIRGLRRGLTWRVGLALGATLAIAPLLKGTGYFLFPVAALGVLGMLVRGRDRRTVVAVGTLVVSAIAVTALWGVIAPVFGRTIVTAPGGNNVTSGVLAVSDPVAYLSYVWQLFFPPIPGTGMQNIYAQRVPAFTIYILRGWGAFGWYAILMPAWVLISIGVIVAGFAVLGGIALWRLRDQLRPLRWEVLVLLAIPVCVFLGVEAVYASEGPRPGAVPEQGRYIFPAITALASLAVGACFAFGRRLALPLATLTVIGVIGLSLYGRLLEVAGFYT
ncbi:DUF2142 domain-containing protein [Solirubrobacter taibaiensis]|nr:DUF2142 domain-containing protein [Solirubrobacter taibaiensis]